jgi:hypothetical protein
MFIFVLALMAVAMCYTWVLAAVVTDLEAVRA